MRILLVEPWQTGSHMAWAEGYRAAGEHEIDIVGLPGELWRWRLRGGALPLAEKITTWIDINGQPDLLLVSGLVDVAEMLGLARRNLSPDVGVVIYQHESQLVYPVAEGNYDNGAALRNWMSWCVADLVLFNSYHHMRSVTDALPGFIRSLPDATHEPMVDTVIGRFEVLPVGVDLASIPERDPYPVTMSRHDASHSGTDRSDTDRNVTELNGASRSVNSRPVILWPHRWERDKDPTAFVAALRKVREAGLDFGLVLAGQDPPSGSTVAADERSAAEKEFADHIVASGDFERQEYLTQVANSDLIVSCAKHEFFGVAVVEAVASGCVPLLPNALSYPELIRPPWHSSVLYEPGTFGTRLVDAVARIDELRDEVIGLPQTMRRFDWETMAKVYDNRLSMVTARLAAVA
ncbi:MAG: tRNA-queuosine alpha-mannosyltransferase domain-containing protein [Acidimicrobiales bacterium]